MAGAREVAPEGSPGLPSDAFRSDASILILRDPRESVRKCSLTPLRGRDGVEFVNYHPDRRVDAGGRLLLHPEGPRLEASDRAVAGQPLFLIDCSWRRLPSLFATVVGEPLRRSLPPLASAYPRKSSVFADPAQGLASIEALYAACALLGLPREGLLDGYLWKESFLELNPELP